MKERTSSQKVSQEINFSEVSKNETDGTREDLFCLAGGTQPSIGHYYRIHGPTFLIEFDNTQNNANHSHSVWRDLENDFGEDLLKKHYEQSPHHRNR